MKQKRIRKSELPQIPDPTPQSLLRITERENPSSAALDTKPTAEILRIINREDRSVAPAVEKVIPRIARAVDTAVEAISRGGRMIYLGAGTSGRLGVLDAAECGPTFDSDRVQAVIAGGRGAMLKSSEETEDNPLEGERDLRRIRLGRKDVLVGISASGQAPYVLGGMRYARRIGARTVGLTVNPAAPMKPLADVFIAPVVGPEVLTGSSRMKAGTAQKLVLNMLSTTVMVRLGRVFSSWMVNMRLTNRKLRERGQRILTRSTGASPVRAARTLRAAGGNLPLALLMFHRRIKRDEAQRLLATGKSLASLLRGPS
ncbi:MAG: N-acetylmuramic acid 6-phosphate etherase [Terriglobia bacterium]|jgi:N-acetylmuramic acid 6-phosphate etherase